MKKIVKSQIKRKIQKLKSRFNNENISASEYYDTKEKIKNLEKKIYPFEIRKGWNIF